MATTDYFSIARRIMRRATLVAATVALVAVTLGMAPPAAAQACEFWVAPGGSDGNSGTSASPWATITHAVATVPDDGCTVWVRDGLYAGGVEIERRFTTTTTVKAVNTYQAVLEHTSTVIDFDGAMNVVIEGLEVRHSGSGSGNYVVNVDRGGDFLAEQIVLRNNIIHDSFDNDLLKIHDGVRFATVEGNLFYNQGPSEQHMDVNSVSDVVIQDNVFFNDYAASGRAIPDAKHFIIIKDSNDVTDGLVGSQRITVRRNVFFNWQGGTEMFVKVGNDGNATHEAIDVWVQSNLFIGNSSNVASTAFGVAGAKNVSFTNNTVVGDLPSKAYAFDVDIKGDNPLNENIEFVNNIWSDPTGTMGSDGPGDDNEFANGDPAGTIGLVLDNNLYWNGASAIPTGELVSPLVDDASRVVGNPLLETNQAGLVTPTWNGSAFADGNSTVRDVFVDLVETYGKIPAGSPAIGAADPDAAPPEDILGNLRSDPDLGAYEEGGAPGGPTPPPGSSGSFVDDNGNIHEGFIEAIAAEGITLGCNPPLNDRYCPDDHVTRGQMAAFLVRALGLPAASKNWFVDDDTSIFHDDINRLAEAGITLGCNPPANDDFCPSDEVTRGQMAAFLVRAYGYVDPGPGNWFVDDNGSIFQGDIDRLAQAGVTKGCNPPANDRYCPADPVRRDQMASFLGRAEGLTPIAVGAGLVEGGP